MRQFIWISHHIQLVILFISYYNQFKGPQLSLVYKISWIVLNDLLMIEIKFYILCLNLWSNFHTSTMLQFFYGSPFLCALLGCQKHCMVKNAIPESYIKSQGLSGFYRCYSIQWNILYVLSIIYLYINTHTYIYANICK